MALLINSNVTILTVTTPNTTTEPHNAFKPFAAIVVSSKDVNVIRPVNAVIASAAATALPICLLFLDSFSDTDIRLFTISNKAIAPNVPNRAGAIAMVKNIDVISKLPVSIVMFFAAFEALSIFFLFAISF